MIIWQIIGIEPTRDITQIKRAYAQQLKIHHPEDDPQGYQRLREAYEKALKLAKQPEALVEVEEADEDDYEEDYDKDDSDDFYEDMDEDELENEAYTPFPRLNSREQYAEYRGYSPVGPFMAEVEALYSDFYARISIDRWTERAREELYFADNLPSILKEPISGQYIDARAENPLIVAEQPIMEQPVIESETTKRPFTFKPYMLFLAILYAFLIRVLAIGYRVVRF